MVAVVATLMVVQSNQTVVVVVPTNLALMAVVEVVEMEEIMEMVVEQVAIQALTFLAVAVVPMKEVVTSTVQVEITSVVVKKVAH